jgi:hypothetical protein
MDVSLARTALSVTTGRKSPMTDAALRDYVSALFTEDECFVVDIAVKTLVDATAQAIIRDLLVQGALPTEMPRVVCEYDPSGGMRAWVL